MAVRSGAGIGVVVALVVFVLTTVFLLVLTIVFYSGQTEARKDLAEGQAALDKYVRSSQRGQEPAVTIEAESANANKSVVQFMNDRQREQMELATGNRDMSLEQLRTEISGTFGSADRSLLEIARDLRNRLSQADRKSETDAQRLQESTEKIDALNAALDQLRESHREALARVQQQIDEYSSYVQNYNTQVQDAVAKMEQSIDTLEQRYLGQIDQLENEKDEISKNLTVISSTLAGLRAITNANRLRAENPAMLVDGVVLSVGTNNEVYINRGKNDRMVPGMTFEIYDNAAAIRVDPNTQQLPRGKASILVLNVGDTSSTAKLTRTTPGRPVVRNDVIANAVYDPNYTYKFMVHGKFDVDYDGRPTEAEAEYIRNLVINWGGAVVDGEDIPGDLDFLVLGEAPVRPPDLPPGASKPIMEDWVRRNNLVNAYRRLFEQAMQAQVPVLNSNRFLILIGHTNN